MHEGTLYEQTGSLLNKLSGNEISKNFYLAGGTALALQLGHRKSIDLDFFSKEPFNNDEILSQLKEFQVKVEQNTEGTLELTIDGVKVSFLRYDYPILMPFEEFKGFKLASVLDIACMKVSAISSRGSKKDFIDLFEILEVYSFDEVYKAFLKKYEGIEFNETHIIKSLTYFADADKDPDPVFIKNMIWEDTKKGIISAINSQIEID